MKELKNLQDGDIVRARWGRSGREKVNWGRWQPVTLYIEKYKGEIVTLALKDKNWAEYDPRNSLDTYHIGSGVYQLVAEDYYLEIDLN
jgi:hypothetical protein